MRKSYQRLIAIVGIFAAALALVVVALPRNSGAQSSTPVASTAPPTGSPAAALIAEGEQIYSTTCIACHQAGGKGVKGVNGSAPTIRGAIPALAGDPFETLQDPSAVIETVLAGRAGMPSFSGAYTDEQIAAVISYVRQAFGNHAAAVSPALVTKIRAQLTVPRTAGTPIPSGTPGIPGLYPNQAG